MEDQAQGIHEFKIDLKGIIKLLAQHLYSEKDVFVREMLQNAHDSVSRRRAIEGDRAPAGAIHVRIDNARRSISFSDNGQGLTESEIHNHLATIGRSGTEEFRQKLIQLGRRGAVSLIGQFGIGLLSTFVVAEYVEVVTRSHLADQPTCRWVSYGEKDYTLEKLTVRSDGEDGIPRMITQEHNVFLLSEYSTVGTTVTLHIAVGSNDDLLQVELMRKTIRKYADFLSVPIYLNDESTPTNAITPPWQQIYADEEDRQREYFAFLNKRYPDLILHVIQVNITSPYRIYGVLYISERLVLDLHSTGSVDLYHTGMFVQTSNREILPVWAKFVRGILDSPDLTLTASRDGVKKDKTLFAVREALGEVIIGSLKQLAKEKPDKLKQLLKWHASSIMRMAYEEEGFHNEIADMVPFETNRGVMDLQTYFQYSQAATPSGEPYLFYFTENSSATLYYLLCDERGLIVINASGAYAEAFLKKYAEKHPIKLQTIDISESESIFTPLSTEEEQQFQQLKNEAELILGSHRSTVQIVRFRPRELPAVLMFSTAAKRWQDTQDINLPESVRKALEQLVENQPRGNLATFYLNGDNPIIQRLRILSPRSEVVHHSIAAIYNTSSLLAAPLLTKRDTEEVVKQFNKVIDLLIDSTANLEKTRTQLSVSELTVQELRRPSSSIEKTQHVTCYVAIPFQRYKVVLEALQTVLEDKPYFWQVTYADQEHLDPTIYGSVFKHIARAHCYIAEISEQDFNVGLELGIMQQFPDRPKILLRHVNAMPVPANIRGAIHISYPAPEGLRKDDLVELLRDQLPRRHELKAVRGEMHYLSPTVIHSFGLDPHLAKSIAQYSVTAEAFIKADPKAIAHDLDTPAGPIPSLQEYISTVYDLPRNKPIA